MKRGPFHPNIPFQPKRWPFFYGWVVVAVGTLCIVMSMPGQTNGVSVFTDHLLAALNLSRMELSIAYLIGTGLSGFMLPTAGKLLDKLGARRMSVIASLTLAVVLLIMSTIDYLSAALAVVLGGTLSAFFAVVLGFTLLRFSGQGLLTVVGRVMLGKWFEARRGLISALTGTVISFAFAFSPYGFQLLIDATNWRGAWWILAGIVAVGMAGLGWLLARDNPEECGLEMDGGWSPKKEKKSKIELKTWHEASRSEALRTPAFWAVTIAMCGHGCVFTGMAFHIIAIGAETGMSEQQSAALFQPMAIIAPTVGFIVGFACDYVRMNRLLVLMALSQVIACVGGGFFTEAWGPWVCIIGFALSSGFFGPISTVAFARFYGRKHLGAISGAMMAALVWSSAIGPAILALSEYLSGSFSYGFLVCISIPVVALMLSFFAHNPQEKWKLALAESGANDD